MKTFLPTIDPNGRKWYVVDMEGQTLGRVAIKVACILRGKNKPIFTPHIDTGDHVIIVNAASLKVTGAKMQGLKYYNYSGYPGGLRTQTLEERLKKSPARLVEHTVWRMLPKTRLGRKMIKKLHVYPGAEHPHKAQRPEKLQLR